MNILRELPELSEEAIHQLETARTPQVALDWNERYKKITNRHNMNPFEKACREWLKGCSVSLDKPQEYCDECTVAFLEHIKGLA